jgi:transposase
MRPLKSHFPDRALTTLDTLLKQTKEARVFRRAQAVREVVAGHHINAVSEVFHLANSALRTWVQRFAQEGPQGLRDRPRSGRPPKVTCELEQHLNRLVDQDPLEHGSLHSQWSCQELAVVLARQTGIQLSRERVREVLKKKTSATAGPQAGSTLTRRHSPAPISNSLPWSTGRAKARSFYCMKMKPSSGGLPCLGQAGGAKPNALASRYVP